MNISKKMNSKIYQRLFLFLILLGAVAICQGQGFSIKSALGEVKTQGTEAKVILRDIAQIIFWIVAVLGAVFAIGNQVFGFGKDHLKTWILSFISALAVFGMVWGLSA